MGLGPQAVIIFAKTASATITQRCLAIEAVLYSKRTGYCEQGHKQTLLIGVGGDENFKTMLSFLVFRVH